MQFKTTELFKRSAIATQPCMAQQHPSGPKGRYVSNIQLCKLNFEPALLCINFHNTACSKNVALALHHGEHVMVMSAFSSMHHWVWRGGQHLNTNYTVCISASISAQLVHGGSSVLCARAARGVIHLSDTLTPRAKLWFSTAVESLFYSTLVGFHSILYVFFLYLSACCICVGVWAYLESPSLQETTTTSVTLILTWLLSVWTLRI